MPNVREDASPRVEELCRWLREYASRRINSLVMDERRCLSPHIVLDFGRRGLLGLTVPERLGGLGLSYAEMIRVLEQLAACDLTLAIFVGIHNGLGIRPVLRFGTDEAREELVPLLAAGRGLGGLAITERAAGSNPRAIETLAHRHEQGWRIRGAKIWIGNGSWAESLNVFARRPPSEGGGMSAFVVRASTPGLRMGSESLTLGMRAIVQNDVFLEDAVVPAESLLGREGEAFSVAEDSFSVARLGISSIALGGIRRCAQLGFRYASRRQIATGLSIDNMKTQESLSWMVSAATCLEEVLRVTAAAADEGDSVPPHLGAICKVLGPELLWTATDKAMQILGGRGYIESNVLPQMARDARLFRVFEGPTEALETHFGSAVLNELLGTDELFSGAIRSPRIKEEFEEALAQCKSARADPGRRIARGHYQKHLVGHLAAWAVLAAAAEQRNRRAPSTLTQIAEAWAREIFQERCQWALRRISQTESLDASSLREVIDGYQANIGDIVQGLPGADYALDPMLFASDAGSRSAGSGPEAGRS